MLDNTHPCFKPPMTNCTLWRYMDLTKLLSLLESKKLYFPRADQFEDPYEGSWSKAGIALLRNMAAKGGFPKTAVDQMLQGTETHRKQMFLSCWFQSKHESAAMWKLYLQSAEGIAIRSDHAALCRALDASPLSARTSVITYIDYDTTPIPFENLFFPFLHKRLSFSHENELRAIVWSKEGKNESHVTDIALSVTVDVVPNDFIKAVHVSPTAPKWFGELVEQLLHRYGLKCPIEKSGLYERPSF
jgi:hypothetical protein